MDGEWEEGNRAPLVTVAQWVVSSSPALLSAVTGLRGRGTGLPLPLLPLSSFLTTAVLSSCNSHAVLLGLWSPPHCLSHNLTPTSPPVLRGELPDPAVVRVTPFSLLALLCPLGSSVPSVYFLLPSGIDPSARRQQECTFTFNVTDLFYNGFSSTLFSLRMHKSASSVLIPQLSLSANISEKYCTLL